VGAKHLKSRPTCAVCGTPVESFTEEKDQALLQVVFVARCHGDQERVRLDSEVLQSTSSVSFGLAFAASVRRLGA